MERPNYIMLRNKNILVTILLIFFSATFVLAKGDNSQTPVDKDSKQVNETEKKVETKDLAPVVPNLNNDQWRKDKIRYRIPKDLEMTQPLITYKEQQVA